METRRPRFHVESGVPPGRRPRLERRGCPPACTGAAPSAPRVARTADQRPPLPRNVAARRPAAPRPRLQRRAARARSSRRRTSRRPSTRTPPRTLATDLAEQLAEPRARHARSDRCRPLVHGAARALRLPGAAGALRRRGRRPRPRPLRQPARAPARAGRRRRSSSWPHRDDSGSGAGADDNASGTAALLELARAYAPPAARAAACRCPTRSASSRRTARPSAASARLVRGARGRGAERHRRVNLDTIAGARRPRLELARRHAALAGAGPRRDRPRAGSRRRPAPSRRAPSALRQLIDLGFPYSRYEQAPFVTRGIPAVTITTAADRPARGLARRRRRRSTHARLGQIGRATQNALDAMQQGVALEPGPAELHLSRQPRRARLGDRARPDRGAPAVPRGHGRPLRPLPAPPHPHRARASQLSQPPRLLALVRRALRPLRARRRVGQRRPRGRRRSPACTGRAARLLGARRARGARLDRRARPAAAAAARARRRSRSPGTPARSSRSASSRSSSSRRTRSRSSSSCPSLHVWVWLPQVRRSPLPVRVLVLLAGFAGPGAPALVVRRPLRPRLGRSVVRRVALRARLCAAAALRHRARLGRGGGTARRARRRPLRAVPVRRGAPAARSAPPDRPQHRARAAAGADAHPNLHARALHG